MCISNMSNSKDIISKAAYLLGVPQSIFDNQYEPPMKEIYNVLTTHQVAVRIRVSVKSPSSFSTKSEKV